MPTGPDLFAFLDKEAFQSKDPEYRGHIISTRREYRDEAARRGGSPGWTAYWGVPDHSTPEYRMPVPYPKVRGGGGFLQGPYPSQAKAITAAKRAIDDNIIE
jgi:hypothetical protein